MLNHCHARGSTDSGPLTAASLLSMTGKQGSYKIGSDDPVRPREEGSEKEKHTLGKHMADEISISGVNVIFVGQQPVVRRWGMRIGATSFNYHDCMAACSEHRHFCFQISVTHEILCPPQSTCTLGLFFSICNWYLKIYGDPSMIP